MSPMLSPGQMIVARMIGSSIAAMGGIGKLHGVVHPIVEPS